MRVSVAEWEFGDYGLHYAVGDVVDMYLTVDPVPGSLAKESDDLRVTRVVGTARPVAHGWDAFSAVVSTAEGVELYCREPAVGLGTVDFLGRIGRDHVDPPEALEPARLLVHRVWMFYDEAIHTGGRTWARSERPTRYLEVTETHDVVDPRMQVDLPTTEEPTGPRPRRGQTDRGSYEVVAFMPPRQYPVGVKREVWSGAVLDVSVAG